jgi:hypothetical protein
MRLNAYSPSLSNGGNRGSLSCYYQNLLATKDYPISFGLPWTIENRIFVAVRVRMMWVWVWVITGFILTHPHAHHQDFAFNGRYISGMTLHIHFLRKFVNNPINDKYRFGAKYGVQNLTYKIVFARYLEEDWHNLIRFHQKASFWKCRM